MDSNQQHSSILSKRCFNHRQREAVAKCLECGRFFCRECITEHEDRVICSVCLKKVSNKPEKKKFKVTAILRVFQVIAGIIMVWFMFYYVGQMLLKLPSSFHEGELWRVNQWEEDL